MHRIDHELGWLIAPNPGPMTERGTNTWILGDPPSVVIDPGPDDAGHLAAILSATGGRVDLILVTHAHLDHSPLAAPLGRATGAPVLAFGPARAGRPERAAGLHDLGGGEGVDAGFAPDRTLADGETVETAAGPIRAMWTPGHFGNHLSFVWRDTIFSGDLVMGWSTSLVSPPDGDMADYMASCRKLRDAGARRLFPGHGAPVEDPSARIDWLLAHRTAREAQILDALAHAPGTAAQLAGRIYTDTAAILLPAATRNVLAHLLDLEARARVTTDGPATPHAIFHLA